MNKSDTAGSIQFMREEEAHNSKPILDTQFMHQEDEFSVSQIEYPPGGSSIKGSHVYFLLQVLWVILLFCQIVLLFDINVLLMLPW